MKDTYFFVITIVLFICSSGKAQVKDHKQEKGELTIYKFTPSFNIAELSLKEVSLNQTQPNIKYQFLKPDGNDEQQLVTINVLHHEKASQSSKLKWDLKEESRSIELKEID